jgi:hypothetical protein
MVVRVVGFDPRCYPAQPSPARLARPRCPTPPMRPLLSLSHLDFPRSNLSLPLPSLSPRGALGLGDGDHRNLDPEVSSPPLPSPLSLPLSLSLLSPPARAPSSLLCARVHPCPSPSGVDAAPPLRSPAALGPPLPSPAALGPAPPRPRPARSLPSPPRRRSAPPLPQRRSAPPLPRPARPLLSPLRRRSACPCSPAPRRGSARARPRRKRVPARARPLRGRGSARPRRASSAPGDAAPALARGLDPPCTWSF